jgi:hypothetical protein
VIEPAAFDGEIEAGLVRGGKMPPTSVNLSRRGSTEEIEVASFAERAPRALSPRTAGPTQPPDTAGAGRSEGLVSQ